MTQSRHRMTVALAAVGIGLAGVAGCSSSAPPVVSAQSAMLAPTSPPTSPAALCSSAADFRTAVADLAKVNAQAPDAGQMKAALQNVATTGNKLADAAQAQFAPEVADLHQAVGTLKATVNGVNDQASLQANLGAVISAATSVGLAAGTVVNAVKHACPGQSSVRPTPSVAPTS